MNRLQELRKQKGLTQTQLGKMCFVKQNTISKWETGQTDIGNDTLLLLSDFFGVPVDYILGKDDTKKPAAQGSEQSYRDEIEDLVSLAKNLSPEDRQRVRDFVAGLKAAREEPPTHPS